MSFKRSVLIFGRSLNLAGIGACLKQGEGLDVFDIDPSNPDARQHIEELNPEVIIFDLSDPPNDLDLALLRNKPGLLLLGVDASSDEVFVLKGLHNRVVTANELSMLIVNHTNDNMVKKKGYAEQ
jgi:hypothetical protein